MSMLISVVIATYRRPQLLVKCLDCLENQTLDKTGFEVIIISDGKDEVTAEAILKWKTSKLLNLHYTSLSKKSGPAAGRNLGWQMAKGELIAFTDDDCLPDAGWLGAYCKAFKKHKNCAFSGRTIVPVSVKPTDYEKNISGLAAADFITANCCCPRAFLEVVGGFDERFTMAWREDSDLEFKLITKGIKIIKADNAVVVHPVRKAPWGVSYKDQKKTLFNPLLYKNFPKLYRQKIQPQPPYRYYFIIVSFLVMLTGVVIKTPLIALIGLFVWFVLIAAFVFQRLKGTFKTASHVAEMIATSAVIPFLSIYWQWHGCFKYRVLLF